MKYLLLLLLVLPNAVSAEDLFCEGNVYFQGQKVDATRVFRLDKAASRASVQTYNGWASGTFVTDPEIYRGRLDAPDGQAFWFNLNRFNGDLIVVPTYDDPSRKTIVDFEGTCKRAEPKL